MVNSILSPRVSGDEDRQLDNEGLSTDNEGIWRHNRSGSCSSTDSKSQTQVRWVDIITGKNTKQFIICYLLRIRLKGLQLVIINDFFFVDRI